MSNRRLLGQLLPHVILPPRPKRLHGPNDTKCADPANDGENGEEPPVANGCKDGLSNYRADAAEDGPHEGTHSHATGASLGEKLCEPRYVLADSSISKFWVCFCPVNTHIVFAVPKMIIVPNPKKKLAISGTIQKTPFSAVHPNQRRAAG